MVEKKKSSTLDLAVCVLAVVASLVQFFLAYAFEHLQAMYLLLAIVFLGAGAFYATRVRNGRGKSDG